MEQENKQTELEQNQGAQQGNIDNDRDMGRKSQSDTAGTEKENVRNEDGNANSRSDRNSDKGQQVSSSREDSHAGITRTTHYGPDMPGSWREPDGHKDATGEPANEGGSQSSMRD